MNGNAAFSKTLLDDLIARYPVSANKKADTDVVICPAFPYLSHVAQALSNTGYFLGAQTVSEKEKGAFTGEVSAEMLVDLGCRYAIVGHSERRANQQESSLCVAEKHQQAMGAGLIPILCVGETLQHREQGKTFELIEQQLSVALDYCGIENIAKGVVAYEPVWAIGTGKSATPEIAQEMHAFIRSFLGEQGKNTQIIYGGSVKPTSALSLFSQEDIDGALVGGAALNAEDFAAICLAAEAKSH